jgi:predicted DCC family thiol-disulfide oxidoreductase YuxK
VQFVIRHDPAGVFRFASLQSQAGRRLVAKHGVTADSVVLIEDGRAYVESEAAIRIGSRLGWPVGWLRGMPFRDAVYRWIARNRYRWFGRREVCWLPTPELKSRFLS